MTDSEKTPLSNVVDWGVRIAVPLVIGAVGWLGSSVIALQIVTATLERTTVQASEFQHALAANGATRRQELTDAMDRMWRRFSEQQDLRFGQIKEELQQIRDDIKDAKAK